MKFIREEFKFTGMRKPQDFVIYPCLATDSEVLLQSDNRIMRVRLNDGKAILSSNRSSGSYGPDLCPERGAKLIELTGTELERVKLMRDRMAGVTNADRTLTILG